MIVEDERDQYLDYTYDSNPAAVITPIEVTHDQQISFSEFIDNFHSMRDTGLHFQLRNDLIKHQWEVKGREDANSP